MNQPIAERVLLFSTSGSDERQEFVLRILAPTIVRADEVAFPVANGTARCIVEFDGLPGVSPEEYFGADSVQALQLASNVEPVLKRLSKKFDFYFLTGEGYFDE
jgi:hypothetical protein